MIRGLTILFTIWFVIPQPSGAGKIGAATPEESTNSFFALCMDTHDSEKRTLREQAELLAELGYDGAGHLWLDDVEERLRTLDEFGLRLFQIYLRVDITPEKPPYDSRLKEVLPLLKGRDVMLALLVGGMPPSDTAGDPQAVEILREIADMAAKSDTRLALYPHSGDWLEKVEDGVRLTRKVDRPNVGVMFNLCHWLKVDDEKNLKPLLTSAMPHLFAVSVNGTDSAEEIHSGAGNWIQPLDSGSFDMRAFLQTLEESGYRGPVGLQCYGIGGDARDHLGRSAAAWRGLTQACDGLQPQPPKSAPATTAP
jgi:sugar phosphate isomerase/epimerase